jgi:hypothetical protein
MTMKYPNDWARCPVCDMPSLDGHITCGDVRCNEGEERRKQDERYRKIRKEMRERYHRGE